MEVIAESGDSEKENICESGTDREITFHIEPVLRNKERISKAEYDFEGISKGK
jgi:hypothetical protein